MLRSGQAFRSPPSRVIRVSNRFTVSYLAGHLHVTTSSFDRSVSRRYPVACEATRVSKPPDPCPRRSTVRTSETCRIRQIGQETKTLALAACVPVKETAPEGVRRTSATPLGVSRLVNGLVRIIVASILPLVTLAGFLSCINLAFGQTKPDGATASVDSLGVHVKISACASDAYGTDQTKTNCYNFGIYRNPTPGFDKPSIGTAYLENSSVLPFTDPDSPNLKVGQAYSYRVCTNLLPNNGGSNCLTTNTITIPPKLIEPPPFVTLTGGSNNIPYGSQTTLSWTSANAYKVELSGVGKVTMPSGWVSVFPSATQTYTITATASSGKQASASFTVNVYCPTPTIAEPVNAYSGPSGIDLKWTNPSTPAGKWCPVPSNQVLIYRMGPDTNGFQLVTTLTKSANNGVLPDHYLDKGPFQPHMGYDYAVCEVAPPNWLNPYDCNFPHETVVSWGADPVLTATRINGTTVRLRLNLDQNTISSVVITRQGSDDPCRQGKTLGNGLQGCPSNPITLAENTPVIYSWTATPLNSVAPGFDHPQTPPFVIDIPDDATVHPGAEYWYQTAVVWLETLEQDAAMVTVPSFYATAGAKGSLLAGGVQPIKSNGNAPPPQSGSMVATAPIVRTATPTTSSAMMRPAVTASAAPAQPSVTAVRPAMAPMMTPATPMLQPGQPMMSSTGAADAPKTAPPVTGAKPMITATGSVPTTSPKTGVLPRGASHIGRLQQKPLDAQALFTLGKAYCGKNLKNVCESYMYMALSSAQSSGNTALVKQIKASLGTK